MCTQQRPSLACFHSKSSSYLYLIWSSPLWFVFNPLPQSGKYQPLCSLVMSIQFSPGTLWHLRHSSNQREEGWAEKMPALTVIYSHFLVWVFLIVVSNPASDKTFLAEITFFQRMLTRSTKTTVLINCYKKSSQPRLSNVVFQGSILQSVLW